MMHIIWKRRMYALVFIASCDVHEVTPNDAGKVLKTTTKQNKARKVLILYLLVYRYSAGKG